MEALAAQVTADFAALNRDTPTGAPSSNPRNRSRRGKPKPVAGGSQRPPVLPDTGDSTQGPSQASQQPQARGSNNTGRGRGPRRRGPRNAATTGGGGQTGASSTASSDAEHALNGIVDLPAPATQTTQPQRQARGQRYRSQLSEAAPGPSRSAASSSTRHAAPTEEELEKLSYRERLTAQLNTSSIDCPICINNIHRRQPIASCQTCSAPYHLKCLRDWAERSIATVKEKAALLQQQDRVQIRANWRCPSCQTQYPEDAKPKGYWCFCGRLKDPQGSPLGNAHSCEQPCKKSRPEGCNHPCPLLCHPGTCDPCNVMLRMRCHCGQEEKTIKCGTLHPQTAAEARIDVDEFLSCGNTCGRMLSCGLHKCEKTCHSGDCGDCEIVREKTCYCGRHSTTTLCGGAAEAEKREDCVGKEAGQHWVGEYACGEPCPWTYDCGKHTEAKLSSVTCHSHTSSQPLPCPRTPAFVTTCPCGKKALQDLSAPQRTACTDPIPTCGGICQKTRSSCGHTCSASCHEGPCPPCEEQVTLVCRCGNDKKTMMCKNVSSEDATEFQCERICRALRACGKHECGRKCCPLAYQEANKKQRRRPIPTDNEDPLGLHICDRVCGKKLNCGQHNCEQPDHRGPCPPCLRSSFEEISCNCGSTVLMPPVPCSTRIQCNQPCARPDPPCGHAKPPHTCHEDDVPCPPCPFLIEKKCMCGSSSVKNVRCSQPTVSCGKTCGRLLSCGYHKCRKMCHLPGECEDCTQTCGKPKSICGHPCQKKCHAPSKCSQDEPCAELVEATCPCGNVKQRARCGACTSSPSSNGGQKLACTPACAVAQRNAALAEAFGISKDRQAGSSQATIWLQDTLTFYGENMNWAKQVEQTFNEFITSSRATHLFSPMKYPQRKFIHEVAQKYKLRSESLDEEPFRSVLIAKKADSAAPKPTLSDAWIATFKQSGTTTPTLPAKRTLLTQSPKLATNAQTAAPSRPDVNSLYLEACFGYDAESLRDLIRPAMSGLDFELIWANDEDVVCLVKASHVSAADLTLKLRLLRTTLRHKITNCKSIDAAWYDVNQKVVTYREQSWTSVSGIRTPASINFTSTSTGTMESTNAFSKLSLGGTGSRTPASSSMSASSSATGGRQADAVLSNGLYRAPRAIVMGNSSKTDADESVVDNWEDAA